MGAEGGAFRILGIALDVIFNQSVYLMTLAASYPQWFGWVPAVLRYLGAIP